MGYSDKRTDREYLWDIINSDEELSEIKKDGPKGIMFILLCNALSIPKD